MKKRFFLKANFSAGHIYQKRDWSEQQNKDVFGKCTVPHGHDYTVEVGVPVQNQNEIQRLSKALELEVGKLDHQFLNQIEFFKNRIPTTENIALYFFNALKGEFPLTQVKVFEGTQLSSELLI